MCDVDDPQDAIARSLRLASDDGQLLADQRVQQGRFAGVGTADDGDKTGAEWHCCSRINLQAIRRDGIPRFEGSTGLPNKTEIPHKNLLESSMAADYLSCEQA